MIKYQKEKQFLEEVLSEYVRATTKFPRPMSSSHEAYGVLLEEVEEFWDEVKGDGSKQRKREELIQVAAMALRSAIEVC